MTKSEALDTIRGLALANRIVASGHAQARMVQRNVSMRDIRSALARATGVLPQKNGSWKVDGPDVDGDDLTVVVAIEDGLIVVTVF